MPRSPLPGVRDAVRDVAHLCTAELLPLAVLRLWVEFVSSPRDSIAHWQAGLSAAAVAPEGATALDTLLRIVVAATRHPLDIHRPACPMLGVDEGRFLDMVCLAQHRFSEEARVLLSGWLPPAAVRMALPPLCLFAGTVDRAGLSLPLRMSADPLVARPAPMSDRGVGLVH